MASITADLNAELCRCWSLSSPKHPDLRNNWSYLPPNFPDPSALSYDPYFFFLEGRWVSPAIMQSLWAIPIVINTIVVWGYLVLEWSIKPHWLYKRPLPNRDKNSLKWFLMQIPGSVTTSTIMLCGFISKDVMMLHLGILKNCHRLERMVLS